MRKETAKPIIDLELALHKMGFQYVIGVDECNVFSLAGSIPACAVVMDLEELIDDVRDSKLLTRKKRYEICPKVLTKALYCEIGQTTIDEIDKINIYYGHILAKQRAVAGVLKQLPALDRVCVLVDGNFDLGFRFSEEDKQFISNPEQELSNINYKRISQVAFSHGDELCYTIACASVVCKVAHDRLMEKLDGQYPGYGFNTNAGAPTPEHYKALLKLGLTPIHRTEFCKKFPQLRSMFDLRGTTPDGGIPSSPKCNTKNDAVPGVLLELRDSNTGDGGRVSPMDGDAPRVGDNAENPVSDVQQSDGGTNHVA